MSAYKITCTVIPEREDDARSTRFLVVAPEDRIVWITTSGRGQNQDLSSEGRKRAVAQAGLQSLLGKLKRQETEDGDILSLSDRQIDCRDRNLGKCSRYPQTTRTSSDGPEGAFETGEDECYPGVLECWMLEEEVD
ncbi:MAG: hypothetical protein ACYC5F_04405 [Thermoleophilia bacterium]